MSEITFTFTNTDGDVFSSSDYVKIQKAPNIPMAKEIPLEYELGDGRKKYEHTGIYENRVIPVECAFIHEGNYEDKLSDLETLICGCSGTLQFSNDSVYHWEVLNITIEDQTRADSNAGEFKIQFECDAFKYGTVEAETGTITSDSEDALTFTLTEKAECECIVLLDCSSAYVSSVNINGLVVDNPFHKDNSTTYASTVNQYCLIDTENMKVVNYNDDSDSQEITNRISDGGFSSARIPKGTKTFSIERTWIDDTEDANKSDMSVTITIETRCL